MRKLLPLMILFSGIVVASTSLALGQPELIQSAETKATKKKTPYVPPDPPPGLNAPGNRSEAGSRGSDGQILPLAQQLVAIVPEFERVVESLPIPQVWVLTASRYPTFWFYVPLAEDPTLRFVIERRNPSERGRKYITVYQQEIPISREGFLSITPADSFEGLKEGELYRWSLSSIKPSLTKSYRSLKPIKGWVELRSLPKNMSEQLKLASPSEAIEIYGRNGIWLDSFDAVAQHYRTAPDRYIILWQDFLEGVGLEALSKKPVSSGGSVVRHD